MYVNDGVLYGAYLASQSILLDKEGNTTHGIITIQDAYATPTVAFQNYKFIQTEELTRAGVAVHPYGGLIIPTAALLENLKIVVEFDGEQYAADLEVVPVGTPITFEKVTE